MKRIILSLLLAIAIVPAHAGGIYEGYPATTTVTGAEEFAVDTNLSGGRSPQTQSMTVDQVKTYVFGNAAAGTATATAGAATLNAGRGVVTSEALTTAAAAVYTLTLTNSSITASSIVLVSVGNGTNTTVGPTLSGVTPAAGSAVISIRNTHAASALNGTLKVSFIVIN